jgi:predicted MFS family arabinose efflux permease
LNFMQSGQFQRIVWSLAIAETIVWAGLYYIFAAMLVQWDTEFQWSRLALTGAFTLAIIMSAITAPIAGRIIDRGMGRYLFAGSALTGAVLLGAMTLVTQLWQFYLIWFCIGIMLAGCLYEPCFVILTRTMAQRARRGITIVSLVAGFAGTVSFPSAFYLSQVFGWRGATVMFAAAIIVVAVPLIWWATGQAEHLGGSSAPPSSHSARDPMRIAANPAFWTLALAFALLALNHGMMVTHTLPLLDERGFSKDAAILAMSMIGPMQVLGRIIMVNVEHRISSLAIAVLCQLAVGVAAFCLMGAIAFPFLLAGFVMFQGFGNGVTSIIRPILTAQLLGKQDFGVISGMTASVYITGFATGPTLGSLVWQAGGYDLMLFLAAGLGAVGTLLLLAAGYLARTDHQAAPDGSTGG